MQLNALIEQLLLMQIETLEEALRPGCDADSRQWNRGESYGIGKARESIAKLRRQGKKRII